MAALFAWAPPLPFVNELLGLVTFGVENLDDFCEDLLKLGTLASVFAGVRYAVAALGHRAGHDAAATPWVSRAFAVAAVGVAYPATDKLSDSFAWHAQELQENLRAQLGLPPSEPEPNDLVIPTTNTAVNIIDDVVEDVFKSACVVSHYTMGALLGGTMRRIIAEWVVNSGSVGARYTVAVGNAASALVIVGTPAGRYSKCDKYGDRLGDLVQDALLKRLGAELPH